MDLSELDQLLDESPVVTEAMHPASVAYLRHPVTVYPSVASVALALDAIQQGPPHRAICLTPDPYWRARFPVVHVEHDPFTSDLNRVLMTSYDYLSKIMLTQGGAASRIVGSCQQSEAVVLVLLDGLSFSDCTGWPSVEPCLASAPTITSVGFPSVIGDPPIAARMFGMGYTRRVGFTYWERSGERLTDQLFRTITDTRKLDPRRPDAFNQVLEWIDGEELRGTYVQVVRSALDEFAEGHRTAIPRAAVVDQIRADLESVARILRRKDYPSSLFAISDHGILWKDDGHRFESVSLHGGRYAEGSVGPGRGRCFVSEGRSFWVLDYPQVGRTWRANQQGIHGGLSFQEALVPFVHWQVNV